MNIVKTLLVGIGIIATAVGNINVQDELIAQEVPVLKEDRLVYSSEFKEVVALENEMLDWIEDLCEMEGIEDIPQEADYEKAVKVYISADIVRLGEDNREILLSELKNGSYVWVIPLSTEKGNFRVTVARGLPLAEDADEYMTEEEQQAIREKEGKWEITEVAVGTGAPYLEQLKGQLENMPGCSRAVIVGGLSGFHNPVAVGFDDEKAKYVVGLGFTYPVASEKMTNTVVYDFNTIMEQASSYVVELTGSDDEQIWLGAEGASVQHKPLLPVAKKEQEPEALEQVQAAEMMQEGKGWQAGIMLTALFVLMIGVEVIRRKGLHK